MILINKRIFIFGGFQEGGVLNDIFTLDLTTFIWETLKPEGKISNKIKIKFKKKILLKL
jgi:hypothetical protein